MAIKADRTYNGEVTLGAWIRSDSGNAGFQINIKAEDGETSYIIWLTPKAKKMAQRSFQALGVSDEQMKQPSYLGNTLPTKVIGTRISFKTKEETYNNVTKVKVSSIGVPKDYSEDDVAKQAAGFFGGEDSSPDSAEQTDDEFQADDSDIPF